MFGDEQGIRKDIGQFFFDFGDVGVLRLFPKEILEQLAGFEVQGNGEVFGIVKLLPVAFISELYERFGKFVGV